MSEPVVEPIPAVAARPLRQSILRPGLPADQSVYPDDEACTSLHVGVRVEGVLVSVASFFGEARAGSHICGVRIRGMATLPEHRGRGFGRGLVEYGALRFASQGYQELWCNARLTASSYYGKLGFERIGGQFELPGIGPHVVMVRSLDASR